MLIPGTSAQQTKQKQPIGVYYFPGWTASDFAPPGQWAKIKPYADREPKLGWYREGDVQVMREQLGWMEAYGIDYVSFDWFYEYGDVRLGHAIDAYMKIDETPVQFSLLWANHSEATTPEAWRTIVQVWIDRYFRSSRFLTIDKRPVVTVLSFEKLRNDAKASGSDISSYVRNAQAMMQKAGLPPIYLVAGTDDTSTEMIRTEPVQAGFSAVSAYNFHRKPLADAASDPNWGRPTRGYAGLDQAYRAQWREGLKLPIPLVVPMSSGWDSRPWGGSADPLHDRSIAKPAGFRSHLSAARTTLNAAGPQRAPLGVICCWNEYGEGSFVEPTKLGGFQQLEQVRRIFGKE